MSADSIQGVPGSKILVKPTPLERVLGDVAWDSLSEIDASVIRAMVNPMTCPVDFLPYLAWSLSVDVWDPDWPEATKRAVIAASPEVHRIKGTRKAVRLALEALGVSSTITEWWENSPPSRRGTFHVGIYANGDGPVLDITLIRQVQDAIRRSKPKSRVFTLDVTLQSVEPVVVAGLIQPVTHMLIRPAVAVVPDQVAPLYCAGFYGRLVREVTLYPRTSP